MGWQNISTGGPWEGKLGYSPTVRVGGSTPVSEPACILVNIDQWQDVGQAHGEVCRTTRHATTIVEVNRLIDPDMLVEIEADTMLSQGK